MIVENEADIIERCLDSAKDVVDYISICDTGSTDGTVELIEAYIQRSGIPGKVHHHVWEDFAHNRTLSAEAAQQWLQDNGVALQDTYLLLLDADMVLVADENFSRSALTSDSYALAQKSPALSHYTTRLIRASLPWQCVGVVYEYWTCQVPCQEARLQTLHIDDRSDSGNNADKFERDVELLTRSLEEEPDNARYMFYLACSYEGLKHYADAIQWYDRRVKMGGGDEEVWYSKYKIGRCYEETGQWDQALAHYLDAYQFKSDRAEPIYQIARNYRLQGQHNLAYSFAKMGAEIPYPGNDASFICDPVYNYLLDEELSISAYYTPFKDEGFAAVNRLVLNKQAPGYVKDQAYRNMLHYVGKLADADYRPIDIDLPPINEGFYATYNPLNPSIQKTMEGYNLICRTVNYIQIGARHFQSLDVFDPYNTIKTRNFLIKYDWEMNKLSQQEIVENVPRMKYRSRNIEGLEDCRLAEYNGSTWFTCTTLDTNPSGQPQISLCKLSDDRSQSVIQVESLITLFGPNPNRCEKNWLPFVKDDELHVMYSYDPLIIYKPHLDGEFAIINDQVMTHRIKQQHDFSHFFGSAAPVELDDGYLILVHENVYENQRHYLHRFVYLDSDFNIAKLSRPFIFLHKGIEYCCGMTTDHSERQLLLSIGIEDREAYLCSVELDTVRSMLEPVETLGK